MTANLWNLDLPATPNDMDAEIADFGLCNLVREQYLKRLQETLTHNLGALIEGYHVDQEEIDNYIDTCMAEMEKTAIRNCMVAELYRQGMMRMIDDVKISTSNKTMHNALKTIIVNANSELRDENVIPTDENAAASIDPAILHTEDLDNINSSGDVSITFSENYCMDKVHVEPVRLGTGESFPEKPTFDSHNEQRMFAMAVEKYRRTGIRQRSVIPTMCIDPNTMRPNIINVVVANTQDSEHVAETYEFRRKLREMPQESQARVDGMLDRFFTNTADGTQLAFKLSEPEEQAVCHRRIARMVVGRMKPFYDAGRITKSMFKVLAELISKNFQYITCSPSEETVAKTVDTFFSDNTKYICRFEDFSSHFLQQ